MTTVADVPLSLTGQVAIVTGAARGVGLATSRLMLRRGACVVGVDRDPNALASATAELGFANGRFSSVAADVTDPRTAARTVELTLQRNGRVDILVNNAGGNAGTPMVPLWELNPEQWASVLRLNLDSVYLMCRAVVPVMIEQGYGRIVNVASMAGKDGVPNASHYSAAKAGVIGMTSALGRELAQKNVLVNAVTPAVIDTETIHRPDYDKSVLEYLVAKIPMGRMAKADEVAELIGYLASRCVSFSTGAVYDISGGRASH